MSAWASNPRLTVPSLYSAVRMLAHLADQRFYA
jgi:hypothetical protein